MMREKIRLAISTAIREHYGAITVPDFSVAPPENPAHGDYATNVAMALAKAAQKNPMEIARELAARLDTEQWSVEVAAPGFINFYLKPEVLHDGLKTILAEGEAFGAVDFGKGKKARVEYVSANPTGPIHIGNARGGPIGETVARVLEKTGYEVLREYLHNDAGTQVEKMGATLWYWYSKALGEEGEFPEGGYQGEYLREVADRALRTEGRSLDQARLTAFGLDYVFRENIALAARLGISFDRIVKESELLASGKTAAAVEELKQKGVIKEREGAWWFAPADEFLEDRESVVIRSTGQPAYFASDIAYHKKKFTSGYDLVVNVFGSNHHGHVPKLQALTKIYGFDPARFTVVLYQYVRVKRGAEVVTMSKRAGTYITAQEVLDEVGPDSFNFFLLMQAPASHIDFDIALAREQSQQNPVYYVQYAHARCAADFPRSGKSRPPTTRLQSPTS
ncbi:MAG: arginine--tRNA ligase [Patescibacteria group bacterium]